VRLPVSDLTVLRIAHHGVVSGWRQRERELIATGLEVQLLSARRWNEGGRDVDLEPGPGAGDDFVTAARTWGTHPSVFGYDPRPLWRLLGRDWDLVDLHEEPNALATLETVVLLRLRDRLRRRPPTPFVLYSAQNIEKVFPVPFRWIERWSLTHTAGVYVCNVEAGQILRRKGLRREARLIGLGVDVDRFTPAPPPVRSGAPLVVGYVGRLEKHKGIDVLMAALAGLPATELHLYGGGPQEPALRDRAAELGMSDRVHFAGYLTQEELPAAYRSLDVVAVPSLPTKGWLEQFCRVAVEAMASGVPVVASRSGAIPDVVGAAGVLVEPGDADGLRAAVAGLVDPERRSELRAAGLRRAAAFSWPAVAAEQHAFYVDALRRSEGLQEPVEPPWVLVVAYGSADLLRDSVGALDGRFPVVVIDNSSSAETAAVAAGLGVDYVDPGANLGFAAGVNRGLAEIAARGGSGRDVLLLNPDAQIAPAAVTALQLALHADPGLACVAPEQTSPATGEPERVEWPFPSPRAAWLVAVGLGRLDRGPGFVIGSILLLRAEALAEVGPFDERFFLYSEETDWQRRAVDLGWRVGYVPSVHGEHVGAGTGGSTERRLGHFHTSLVTYMDKHHGRSGALAFQLAMITGSAARAVLTRGTTRVDARARLRLYVRQLRRPAQP
jgi:glycosyltransferase involved in cell wall biosynthesis/GT2 family glycosyltransferase